MSELLSLRHWAGPTGYAFPLNFTQVTLGPSTFGQFAITRIDNTSVSTLGSRIPVPLLAAVTGSMTPQSVNVATTALMTAGDIWVIDPGTSVQEVVPVGAGIIDATHVTLECQNSHAAGAVMCKIFSVITKFLFATLNSVPGTGLANFNLIRMSNLPVNVYDQYLIWGSLGTEAYTGDTVIPWVNGWADTPAVSTIPLIVPQYGPTLVSATGNPTNAIVVNAATITANGQIYPQVQIQILFTQTPEPDTSGILYRYWWDDL